MQPRLAQLLAATPVLALALAAHAGAPISGSFSLTGPDIVYLGVPVTFEISGEPATGGAALFVANTDAVGTPSCPPPLRGDCFDIPTPSAMIQLISLNTAAPHSFTVTPPPGALEGDYVLQAGAAAMQQGYKSNTHVVTAIDPCLSLESTVPADLATDVSVDVVPELTFTADSAAYWTLSLSDDLGGSVGATITTTADGGAGFSSIAVDPTLALDHDATYTLHATNLCGETIEQTFTTESDEVVASDLVGTGFVLDTSNATVEGDDPFGAGSFLFVADDTIAYQLLEASPGSYVYLQGRVTPGTGAQDMSANTRCYTADLSAFPLFRIEEPNFNGGLPATGEVVLDGTLDNDGVAFDVTATAGFNDSGFGVLPPTNGACPISSGTQCYNTTVSNIQSTALAQPLVYVGPSPGCP